MLLIILLGVIAKLAVASADCDINTINRNITDWTKFTGTWYWLYHVPHKYDDNLDCPSSTFDAKTRTGGRVTGYIYVKSTQTYDRLVGTIDWNAKGYIDMIFPVPSSDTKCLADASCSRNPYYARIWTGRYYVVSSDHRRYSIFKNCCPTLDTPCIYVLFRTPNPDERTLNDVKTDLEEKGFGFNQLVKWETNHCKNIKFP